MAYMSQEKKKEIHGKLKGVIPKGWKWSLAVRNHSTLCLTIRSAPINLIEEAVGEKGGLSLDINHYHLERLYFKNNKSLLELFKKIKATMNDGNFDNSDIMTDYFHVGWYVDIKIGSWDKPFIVQ